MKKIGILGSGVVGRTLADGFLKHGYAVKIGTGHPEKLNDWKAKVEANASVGSFSDAASFGEILVLTVKGKAAIDVVKSAGLNNVAGKTIIDTTNPIDDSKPPVNGVLSFSTNNNSSLLEELQSFAKDANFVKAFNSVGSSLMVNPKLPGGIPSMFICGNNDIARAEVKNILTQFGWETEDMGKAEAARAIEPLCILWCIPGFINNQWAHAFKLLKM